MLAKIVYCEWGHNYWFLMLHLLIFQIAISFIFVVKYFNMFTLFDLYLWCTSYIFMLFQNMDYFCMVKGDNKWSLCKCFSIKWTIDYINSTFKVHLAIKKKINFCCEVWIKLLQLLDKKKIGILFDTYQPCQITFWPLVGISLFTLDNDDRFYYYSSLLVIS